MDVWSSDVNSTLTPRVWPVLSLGTASVYIQLASRYMCRDHSRFFHQLSDDTSDIKNLQIFLRLTAMTIPDQNTPFALTRGHNYHLL
jgi:hypothetical protein